MINFKFFTSPLLKSHDGYSIYPNELFYIVHKEGKIIVTNGGLAEVEPYEISEQKIMPESRHLFRPDDSVWYFKNHFIASRYVKMWMNEDKRKYANLKLYV
jgi:hypothetical protein